eukprot:750583-Hanusia_phi.AAC.6
MSGRSRPSGMILTMVLKHSTIFSINRDQACRKDALIQRFVSRMSASDSNNLPFERSPLLTTPSFPWMSVMSTPPTLPLFPDPSFHLRFPLPKLVRLRSCSSAIASDP